MLFRAGPKGPKGAKGGQRGPKGGQRGAALNFGRLRQPFKAKASAFAASALGPGWMQRKFRGLAHGKALPLKYGIERPACMAMEHLFDSTGSTLQCSKRQDVCLGVLNRDDFTEVNAVDQAIFFEKFKSKTFKIQLLNFCVDQFGYTILSLAASNGMVNVCKAVLDHPEFTQVNSKDRRFSADTEISSNTRNRRIAEGTAATYSQILRVATLRVMG